MIQSVLRRTKSLCVVSKWNYAACYQSTHSVEQFEKTASPYADIPGPSILKLLRGFMPNGKYANLNFIEYSHKLRAEYGDIVRLPGFLRSMEIVMTFEPDDFEKVFRSTGKWPVRNGMETFTYYRKHIEPEIFDKSGGLLTEHGRKWADVRTKVNPVMMLPKIVKLYVPAIDAIAREFTHKIRDIRDSKNEVPEKFDDDLAKWGLESISYIALNKRLGLLDESNTSTDGQDMIRLIEEFFSQSESLELKPSLWRYFATPTFNKQMKTLKDLTGIIIRNIDEAAKIHENSAKRNDSELSVLEKLLKIDKNLAVVMAADMMFAGIDTTSGVAASLIYTLATNPDKQQILREEIMTVLPEKDTHFAKEDTMNLPYLRACLKETIRLHPIVFGNLRESGEDIVLRGYSIPKGSNVFMMNIHAIHDAKYFPEPEKFLPERWLKAGNEIGCPSARTAHPFAYMPFGFGSRACIGKRFAELEVEMLVSRLVRNFKIEWNYPALKWKTTLLTLPDSPLRFKFTDLEK